jgi:hypothetical protein
MSKRVFLTLWWMMELAKHLKPSKMRGRQQKLLATVENGESLKVVSLIVSNI